MGSPGLLIFAVIMIAAMLAIIGIGVVVALIIAGAIAALISAGIISSSLVVGFKTRSVSKAIRLTVFQTAAAVGTVAGLGVATVVKVLSHSAAPWFQIEIIGVLCGIVFGLLVGGTINVLLKLLQDRWKPQQGFEIVPSTPRAQ